jgi:ABC-type antimicrobial peptide transport system permease subunit
MGVFGLLLAAIGIYGLTAFVVSRRAREMAIRLALGATEARVARLTLRQTWGAPAIGMVVGLGIAGAFSIVAGRFVPGVRAGDPVVFVLVPAVLLGVAMLAVVAPLRRMLGGSPMAKLREE